MADPINISDTLGISSFNIGLGSTFLNVIIMIFIAVVIIGLVGVLIVLWILSKAYKYRIPLYARVGNITTRIGTFKAKEVPFGRAGDKLWFVKGKGLKKWTAPATIQSAPNEFWHYVREDGEWVNFSMEDLDEKSKKAGVKYVAQPMRLQRLATDRLLEQRLMNKGFWEKWGVVIGYVIFFLVITIALVVFFHQYGKVTEQLGEVVSQTNQLLEKANNIQRSSQGGQPAGTGLIPALIIPFIMGGRKWLS
jgi:flagellar basal body-associated protein FliL